MTRWLGNKPGECDICHGPIGEGDVFYDAKTTIGPWATLDEACFHRYGIGLGTGVGQKFDWSTGDKLEG